MRRLFLVFTALAIGFAVTLPSSHLHSTEKKTTVPFQGRPGLNHLKCYQTNGPALNETALLKEQFRLEKVTILGPERLCTPVEKTHRHAYTPVLDPDAHLQFYGVETSAPTAESRKVVVQNQFGAAQQLSVRKLHYLAVPTQKLDPGKHDAPKGLSHYKCYNVRGKNNLTKVGLKDQFMNESAVSMGDPKLLCDPIDKPFSDGEVPIPRPQGVVPIKAPLDHLVCYAIDGGSIRRKVVTQNQFGRLQAELDRADILCVPSRPIVPEPVTETSTHEFSFLIDGPNSVPFDLFSVLTPGRIRVEANWTGGSQDLTVELTGRRRPGLPDPAVHYARVTGPSPQTLTYPVTEEDVARGVGWRLIIRDASGDADAQGNAVVTVPFDTEMDANFQREKIALRSGELWPKSALQEAFAEDLEATSAEGLHALVSLKRASTCPENHLMRQRGIIRQSYLPRRNAFAFIRKGINLADPAINSLVRAITPFEPEDKINPHILVGDYARFRVWTPDIGSTNTVLSPDGTLELSVLFARDASRSDITEVLTAETTAFAPITDFSWHVTLAPDRLTRLAAYDIVESIDAGPAPDMPDNDRTRGIINVDLVQAAVINATANTITYNGLSGNGITAGIHEGGGLDAGHPDLNVVVDLNAPRSSGSHPTHVAGILAGSGEQSSLNDAAGNPNGGSAFQWRGMAPEAALVAGSNLINGADLLSAIQNHSLDLLNRSQSVSFDGAYDRENQNVDRHVRGDSRSGDTAIPRRLHVYSSGNHGRVPGNQAPAPPCGASALGTTGIVNGGQTGYFSLTKQTKNTVVVGNWNAITNTLRPTSSLGPAHDGRIKPDLVAPGTDVTSTGTVADGVCNDTGIDASDGYTVCGGSSMAAPVVAGGAALMLEAWQDTYNLPAGFTLDDNPPLPSTLRALLVQTAVDIDNPNVRNATSGDVDPDNIPGNANDGTGNVTATVGPDYSTGWGLPDIQAAVDILEDARSERGIPVPNRMIQDTASQGTIKEYDFVVDQAGPLKVTLAWDDAEVNTNNLATDPMLINDLDLELVAPDGTVHYPWQLGHSILDAAGNTLADNSQPPGTNILIERAIAPINNPQHEWLWACIDAACTNTGCAPVGPDKADYIPEDAIDDDGVDDVWVARTGKDHLNNLEQVLFDVPNNPAQFGHWRARIIGFKVDTDVQDYSFVGFPYPELAELVVTSEDKVALPGFGTDITFDWAVTNVGEAGTGTTFNYQILLSRDFRLGDDVVLTDTHASATTPPGPLATDMGASRTSTVRITQADAAALLGDPGATFDDLLKQDVFLLVRADSDDDILEHEETNITFIQLARLVDVVMVMDRSGSMSSDMVVSAGKRTKLQLMQDSASLFLDLLRQDAGDRLGQVSFATSSSVNLDDGSGNVTNFGAGNIGDAETAVSNLTAGGLTNIAAALQDAVDLIPVTEDRRRVVVFLSDGKRTTGADPAEAAFLRQFDEHDIKVFSVGFGTVGGSEYAGLDLGLLQTLSNVGDLGFYHVTEGALDLDKFFVDALAGAVDASVIVDPVDEIEPGERQSVPVAVNTRDSTVTFILTWANPRQQLELSLRTPSGIEINENNLSTFGSLVSRTVAPAHQLMQVRLPLSLATGDVHDGTWQMLIRNHGDNTVRYSASAIAESTVRATLEALRTSSVLTPLSLGTPGTTIQLRSRLTGHGDSPIPGARISVTPRVPLVSIGDVLSAARLTDKEIAAIPEVIKGDELSLQERMIMALWKRLGRNPLPREDLAPFIMAASRKTGDYTSSFTFTNVAGPYTFRSRVEAVTEDCSPVARENTLTIGIPAVVDPSKTVITVTTDGVGHHTVAVTPRDSAGHFIGPGVADKVEVFGSGIETRGRVRDLLNGTYIQALGAGTGGPVTFHTKVLGVDLPSQTINAGSPAIIGVTPPGGTSDKSVVINIMTKSGIAPAITGVSLQRDSASIPLTDVTIDPKANTIRARIPAGMEPGLYRVKLHTDDGIGAASAQGVFRVIEEGKAKVPYLKPVFSAVDRMLSVPSVKTGNDGLSQLLKELLLLPEGRNLTADARQAALNEVIDLLASGLKRPGRSQIPNVLSVLDRAVSDARQIPVKQKVLPRGEHKQE